MLLYPAAILSIFGKSFEAGATALAIVAFGELANGLGSDIAEFDVRQRRDRRSGGVVDSMALGRHGHHLQCVEMIKQCVLLWDQGEPAAHGAVGARVSPEDLHSAA